KNYWNYFKSKGAKGMNSVFYKNISIKGFLSCTFILLILCCNAIQRNSYADEQIKSSKEKFNNVESIKMKDPLAVVLGAMDKCDVFVYTYADAVKSAGHSCPAVAGAYKSTQMALKVLYGDEVSVRGNIKVTFKGGVDYKVNGPISQVVTLITGASAENGFKGLGTAGKYGRYNLMAFDKELKPDPKAICSIVFQRVDNGKQIEVTYCVEPVPTSERLDKLMPLVISGKASEEESEEFGNLWQERVKTILLNPPDGTFVLKD
ncbi:MAG: FmdE family protein, partial [Planctomycetota bacterium]